MPRSSSRSTPRRRRTERSLSRARYRSPSRRSSLRRCRSPSRSSSKRYRGQSRCYRSPSRRTDGGSQRRIYRSPGRRDQLSHRSQSHEYIDFLEDRKYHLEKILENLEEDINRKDAEMSKLKEIQKRKDEWITEMEDTMMTKLNENRNLLEEIVEMKKIKEISENSSNNIPKLNCETCVNRCKIVPPYGKHEKGSHTMQELVRDIRCIYNDAGHCRYGLRCHFAHVKLVCMLNKNCEDPNCQKRHPLPCRYGSQCIFGKRCSFSHTMKRDDQNMIEENRMEEHVVGDDSLDDEANNETNETNETNESDMEELLSNGMESSVYSPQNDSTLSF